MDTNNLNAGALLRALPAGVVVHGVDTRVLYANPMALKILRLSKDQILGKSAVDPDWKFVDAYMRPLPLNFFPVNLVLSDKKPVSDYVVGVYGGEEDSISWVMANAYPEMDANDEIERVIVTFIDISKTHNKIPFKSIVDMANDVIVVTDADSREPKIVYVNQAFSQLTGYSSVEAVGKVPRFLQRSETDPLTRARIRDALSQEKAVRETILNFHRDGSPYWLDMNIVPLFNDRGELSYFAAIERDISAFIEKEQVLQSQAEHDPLTGLLNRRGFSEIFGKLMADPAHHRTPFLLAILDLDFFKKINDSYGHQVGDRVLQHFATLMKASFRSSDILARFGGEEFVILLSQLGEKEGLRVLDNFREKVSLNPLRLEDASVVPMTVSIGIAVKKPIDADGIDEVFKLADVALYQAKESGRNRCVVVSSS